MKRGGKIIVSVAAAVAAGVALERLFAAPRYRGSISKHFDGRRFLNTNRLMARQGSFLKWQLDRPPGWWPHWADTAPAPAPPVPPREGGRRGTLLNHSSPPTPFAAT